MTGLTNRAVDRALYARSSGMTAGWYRIRGSACPFRVDIDTSHGNSDDLKSNGPVAVQFGPALRNNLRRA